MPFFISLYGVQHKVGRNARSDVPVGSENVGGNRRAHASHGLLQGLWQLVRRRPQVRVDYVAGRIEGFDPNVPVGADGLAAGEKAAAVVPGDYFKGYVEPFLL